MKPIEEDCLKFIKRMLGKEIKTEEKYIGMMELDKKYPGIGFNEIAQKFANRWLKPKVEERLPYKDD